MDAFGSFSQPIKIPQADPTRRSSGSVSPHSSTASNHDADLETDDEMESHDWGGSDLKAVVPLAGDADGGEEDLMFDMEMENENMEEW